MKDNLKNCTHCGGHGLIHRQTLTVTKDRNGPTGKRIHFYFAQCSNCRWRTFPKNTRQEAIDAWNNGYICEDD